MLHRLAPHIFVRSPYRLLEVACLALVLLSSACASTGALGSRGGQPAFAAAELAHSRVVEIGGATFRIEYDPIDEATSHQVEASIARAIPLVSRWGEFTDPIRVTIHPTHDALEIAVNRRNYPWLRAWARYDSIDIQSPRTWGALTGSQHHVLELMAHELTHCLMYQRSGTLQNWPYKGIPLWFREGMASVTASQGYRRPKDADLWRYLEANPEKDPVLGANAIYQTESDIVYGAAHRAFDFLLIRYGQERVSKVLDVMQRDDVRFPDAFEQVIGIAPDLFASEFVRYVRWQGWRGPDEQAFRIYGELNASETTADQAGSAGRNSTSDSGLDSVPLPGTPP